MVSLGDWIQGAPTATDYPNLRMFKSLIENSTVFVYNLHTSACIFKSSPDYFSHLMLCKYLQVHGKFQFCFLELSRIILIYSSRYLFVRVHGSIIHNSQKMEANCCPSVDKWIHKNEVYTYDIIQPCKGRLQHKGTLRALY